MSNTIIRSASVLVLSFFHQQAYDTALSALPRMKLHSKKLDSLMLSSSRFPGELTTETTRSIPSQGLHLFVAASRARRS